MMPAVGDGLRRPVSPLLAGRADELALLLAAFEDVAGPGAGEHGLVHLLGGEAGGGRPGWSASSPPGGRPRSRAAGRLVEASGAGLPYAPFVTALNAHTATVPVDELRDLLGEGVLQELARLVPSLGVRRRATPSSAVAACSPRCSTCSPSPRPATGRCCSWSRTCTGPTPPPATCSPTWSGRSRAGCTSWRRTATPRGARDTRSCRCSPSCRSDGVTRVPVVRLDEAGTADQLEGILGRIPVPALVRTVHERGGGVPLFTEALVTADGRLRSEVPGSLRDLTLAAVRTLPRESRDLLAAAATGGDRVSHRLLCRVTGLDDVGVTDAVRAAVAAQVLEGDGDGYVFRHQLIGEAVRDGVLPGDRLRLHRAYAEALTEQPELQDGSQVRARVADHWHRAGEAQRALAAAWEAAAGAGSPAGSARTGTSGCGCSSWWWRSGTGHRRPRPARAPTWPGCSRRRRTRRAGAPSPRAGCG